MGLLRTFGLVSVTIALCVSAAFGQAAFEHEWFRGQDYSLFDSRRTLKKSVINGSYPYQDSCDDKWSSLSIPEHFKIKVFEHRDYRGRSRVFGPGSYADLERGGTLNYPLRWGDRISSIQVLSQGWLNVRGAVGDEAQPVEVHASAYGLVVRDRWTPFSRYEGKPLFWEPIEKPELQKREPGTQFLLNKRTLFARTPDHQVFELKGKQWWHIGSGRELHGGGSQLFVTGTFRHDALRYTSPGWEHVGGPGAGFVVADGTVFGLTPNRQAVYRRDRVGGPARWQQAGGGVAQILSGENKLYARDPRNGDLLRYEGGVGFDSAGNPQWKWTNLGGGTSEGFVFVNSQVYAWNSRGLVRLDRNGWNGLAGPGPRAIEGLFAAKGKLYCVTGNGAIWEYYGVGNALPF